jgi:hypothetical protein
MGPDPSQRKCLIPKTAKLNVTDSRIAAVRNELKVLKFTDAPNAIAVLFRVFVELSIDHYMDNNGLDQKDSRSRFKSFQDKISEVMTHIVTNGRADTNTFVPLQHAIHDVASPFHYKLLHSYVHNQHSSPDAARLRAGWDQAAPLLNKIWP